MNGFVALVLFFALLAACAWMFYQGATTDCGWWFGGGVAMMAVCFIFLCGFGMLEPNEIYVMVFFGRYVGTYSKNGFFGQIRSYRPRSSPCVPATSMWSQSR